jgi:glycosyltransferase involved in cell wall biosynthesis
VARVSAARVPDQPGLAMVSWIRDHARSRDLTRALNARAVFMPWAWHGQPLAATIAGWLRSGLVTWRLVRSLPEGSAVVAMAPPVFCPLVALLAAWGRGVRVAIDLHSGGLNDPNWRWSFGLMRFAIRRAAAVIVTNPDLLRGEQTGTTTVLIIHDPFWIGGPAQADGDARKGRPYAVFPASGSPDEPVDAVAQAAHLLAGQVEVLVTGDHRQRPDPPGLRRTGFIPTAEFHRLMAHASVVLALTTREATMQRAAYEALQLGRPLVCSDTKILRRVLGNAALFVDNTGPAIASGITGAIAASDELRAAGEAVAAAIKVEAERGLAALQALVITERHPTRLERARQGRLDARP